MVNAERDAWKARTFHLHYGQSGFLQHTPKPTQAQAEVMMKILFNSLDTILEDYQLENVIKAGVLAAHKELDRQYQEEKWGAYYDGKEPNILLDLENNREVEVVIDGNVCLTKLVKAIITAVIKDQTND